MSGWGNRLPSGTLSPSATFQRVAAPGEQTLPGGEVLPASVVAKLGGCGGGELAGSFFYRRWAGPSTAAQAAYVFSSCVPANKFWLVPWMHVAATNPNGMVLSIHMVPAEYVPQLPVELSTGNPAIPFFLGANNRPPTRGSVALTKVGSNSVPDRISASDVAVSYQGTPVFLPPGWKLLGWEEHTTVQSAIERRVTLHAAIWELDLGQPVPLFM